jgi:hypothetical protein
VDGGILGVPLLLGYLGLLVWTVGTSVSLWRGAATAEPRRRQTATQAV